jgi:hypothetical protein
MTDADQSVVEELVGNAHGNLARVRELGACSKAAPVHGAVMGGSAAMVRLLLEHGADPSLPDYKGRGARQLAEDMGRPALAALFG